MYCSVIKPVDYAQSNLGLSERIFCMVKVKLIALSLASIHVHEHLTHRLSIDDAPNFFYGTLYFR